MSTVPNLNRWLKLRQVDGHDDYTYARATSEGIVIMLRVHYGDADECPGRNYFDVAMWDGSDV